MTVEIKVMKTHENVLYTKNVVALKETYATGIRTKMMILIGQEGGGQLLQLTLGQGMITLKVCFPICSRIPYSQPSGLKAWKT